MTELIPAGTPGTHTDIETRHYSDRTSATGPAPLPALSPEQHDLHEAWVAGFVAAARLFAGDRKGYERARDRVLAQIQQ